MTKVGQKIPSKCGEVESEECEIDQHQQGNKEGMQYQNNYIDYMLHTYFNIV